MKAIYPAIIFLALVTANFAASAEEEDPARLIEKLKSDNFDDRTAAVAKLEALGDSAREALEKAVNDPDADTREIVVRLLGKVRRASVVILGFDRDGKPAAGGETTLQIYDQGGYRGNDASENSVTLGPDGRGSLDSIQQKVKNIHAQWKKWSATTDGAQSFYTYDIQGGPNPLFFTLTRGGIVTGKVLDRDGKPVKDATVGLYHASNLKDEIFELQIEYQGYQPISSGASDADGNVKIEGVADGIYTCVVRENNSYPQLAGSLTVRENETVSFQPVKLPPRKNGKLKVALENAEGKPMKGAKVVVTQEFLFEGPNAARMQRNYRYWRWQRERYNRPTPTTIDETGTLALDDLKPGKYRIFIKPENLAPLVLSEQRIGEGEAVELKSVKLTAGGSIKGKVTSADGKGLADATVLPVLVLDDDPLAQWPELKSFIRGQSGFENMRSIMQYHRNSDQAAYVTTKSDGAYELRNLAPGNYMLFISSGIEQTALVCGIKVPADKPVDAPPVTMREIVKNAPAPKNEIRGRVTGPNGKPLQNTNAEITVHYKDGSSGFGADSQGEFRFDWGTFGRLPTMLYIRAQGFKTYRQVFNGGMPAGRIEVQLEKQQYGTLRVRVTDDEGKPLSDAVVDPAQINRYRYYNQIPLAQTTGRTGEVRFKGLASGARKLEVRRPGYFLPEAVKTTISPDGENDLVIKMKKGLSVAGTVDLPAEVNRKDVVVSLRRVSDSIGMNVFIDEKGGFSFPGLSHGDYVLRAYAPGLIQPEDVEVVVKAGTPPPQDIKLKLTPGCGVLIQVDPVFANAYAQLTPKKVWEKMSAGEFEYGATGSKRSGMRSANSFVEGSGRITFWGVPPGQYVVLLTDYDNASRSGGLTEEEEQQYSSNVSQIVGEVEVKDVVKFSEVAKLPPVELKGKPGAGVAVGRMVMDLPGNELSSNRNVYMIWKISGPGAIGYAQQYNVNRDRATEASKPVIVGTLPDNLKPGPPRASFALSGLPAGQYKLTAYTRTYTYNYRTQRSEERKQEPQLLKTFDLKDGERLELGDLKYVPPDSAIAPGAKVMDMDELLDLSPPDEDLPPEFKP